MMDWTVPCNALADWLSTELGVSVAWADANAPRCAYPFALLNIIAERRIGIDAPRYELNVGTGKLDPIITGNRVITVSIKLHTKAAPETNHNTSARALAAQARSSLGKTAVLDALSTAGLAVVGNEQLITLDAVVEGRWTLITSFDLQLALASNIDDSAVDYIETVDSTGSFPPSDVTVTGPWGLGA